jgi:hypothetical protein
LLGPATDLAVALLNSNGCVTLQELLSGAGLGVEAARGYMDGLEVLGGLRLKSGLACPTNRALLAAAAIRLGGDPERVSRRLDWRDFEALVASALQEAGFSVSRSVRLPGRGGLEVDVVGALGRVAVAVDCKRWSYRSSSS